MGGNTARWRLSFLKAGDEYRLVFSGKSEIRQVAARRNCMTGSGERGLVHFEIAGGDYPI